MINLLSTEHKIQLRAARANVFLTRYISIIVLAIAFLVGVLYVSHTILEQTKAAAEESIASNDLKADVYRDTKTQVDTLSSKLSEGKVLLTEEIKYSTLLTTLGKLMPAGTVLDSLKLDSNSFNGAPTEIIAFAKTDQDAVLLQQQLQNSPLLSPVTVKGTDTAGGSGDYPVKITMTVTFNRQAVQ